MKKKVPKKIMVCEKVQKKCKKVQKVQKVPKKSAKSAKKSAWSVTIKVKSAKKDQNYKKSVKKYFFKS